MTEVNKDAFEQTLQHTSRVNTGESAVGGFCAPRSRLRAMLARSPMSDRSKVRGQTKQSTGPPGWGFCTGPTTLSFNKNLNVTETATRNSTSAQDGLPQSSPRTTDDYRL